MKENQLKAISKKKLPARMKANFDGESLNLKLTTGKETLLDSFGTCSLDFAHDILSKTLQVDLKPNDRESEEKINSILAAFNGMDVEDEVEAMIGSHIIAINKILLHFLANTNHVNQTFDGRNACVNRILKLIKAFSSQVELLNKYRNRGKQKVLVEHVNINEGGQAVFGSINTRGGE